MSGACETFRINVPPELLDSPMNLDAMLSERVTQALANVTQLASGSVLSGYIHASQLGLKSGAIASGSYVGPRAEPTIKDVTEVFKPLE